MRPRPTTAALAAVSLVVSLGATLGMSTTAGAARTDGTTAARASAEQALDDAREALRPGGRATRDVTLALRELFLQKSALSRSDRSAADALLARPTTPPDDPSDPYDTYYGDGVAVESDCSEDICLHWTEQDNEAGDAADGKYADETLVTLQHIHDTYVDAGYKGPLPDEGQEGDARTDIYLANVGGLGVYGFCTSDADEPTDGHAYYAYCVLDNDYSPDEFGEANTPIENMQVTAAHEYFHAVQFAYDADEDPWIMEATATWAEDELFDDVNDNLFYLAYGQLSDPKTPLDLFGFNSYGNWIFFRYLTETFDGEQGSLPALVLDIWEHLDSTSGADDQYSTEGIGSALHHHGTTLREQYGDFAAANGHPAHFYEEGAGSDTEEAYPYPPYRFDLAQMSPKNDDTGWRSVKLDHLTSGTGAYTPSAKMNKGGWKLRIKVDMAKKSRGSEARVMIYFNDGTPALETIALDKNGDGSRTVPFDYDDVAAVEVTLANASTTMDDCWTQQYGLDDLYACYGVPEDDGLKSKVRAMAYK